MGFALSLTYDFDVVSTYRPCSTNIAALLRSNKNEHINTTEQETYDFVCEIAAIGDWAS